MSAEAPTPIDDLDAVITRAHTTNTPKKHGLPYRVMHSRPVKVAAVVVAAVGLVGALQELPKFETKTNPTPSGEVGPNGLQDMSKVIIPSASQAPESVPLTELTKTKGVLEVAKKTQDELLIKNATVIEATYDPNKPKEIELEVKLPGDTLTKTESADGQWEDYTGLTIKVRVDASTTITYDAAATTAGDVWQLPKAVFQVGQPITLEADIIANATGYATTEANNAINQKTLDSIKANIGQPNTITSGYQVVASVVRIGNTLPS
jgi:hypothetical protein